MDDGDVQNTIIPTSMLWKYLILLLDIDVEDVVVSRYCNAAVATLGYKLLSPVAAAAPPSDQ